MHQKQEQEKREEQGEWRELLGNKEEFLSILRLLVEFDEKSGRYGLSRTPDLHHLRRAVSLASAGDVRILLKSLGGFVYLVVAEMRSSEGSFLATSWIHEDGIVEEKREREANHDHPVHSLISLTELFHDTDHSAPLVLEESCLGEATLEIMAAREGE